MDLISLLVILGIVSVLVACCYFLLRINHKVEIENARLTDKYLGMMESYKLTNEELKKHIDLYKEQKEINDDLKSQKSSQSTKNGFYYEALAPVLDKFPVDIQNKNVSLRFLGEIADYIAVNYEEPCIYFVEVKTGSSSLSSRQRLLKNMIKEGCVKFVELRLGTNGNITNKE